MAKGIFKPEVTFIDADGKSYPAKITGYFSDGSLPAAREGEIRVTADAARLAHLNTFGIVHSDSPDVPPTQAEKPCAIKEFRVSETRLGAKHLDGPKKGQEVTGMRPVVDLLVNYGNYKKGNNWVLRMGISHRKSIRGGEVDIGDTLIAPISRKPHFIELAEVEPKEPEDKKDKKDKKAK